MLIRLGYDLQFELPAPVSFVAMLHVHPSRSADLRAPDLMQVDPAISLDSYIDSFGNVCTRFDAPAGPLRLSNCTFISDSGEPDAMDVNAVEHPISEIPSDVLRYLMSSRYCEVDRLSIVALDLFGHLMPGWSRVQAVCDWVHNKVVFGYQYARPTKTALDVYTERQGVCRDYQHLAITFLRALNIPARYATGYLGDIRITLPLAPMDFSAWLEVYLSGRWWAFDARNNVPRFGRVLVAVGRDASDVAITTSFGVANLKYFSVISEEVPEMGSEIESPSPNRQ
jgi:transglutaminase-like putative cysteine protease